jgi:hypothetical protein
VNPISSASCNNTSCSTNTAATSASARVQPPEGVARACGPYITSEIRVVPDRNRQQCDQVPAHRDPPAHTAVCEVGEASAAQERGRDQESSEAVHLARVFLREWWPSGLNVNLLSSGLFFGDDNHGQLRN